MMFSKGDMFIIKNCIAASEELSVGSVVVLALQDGSEMPYFIEVYNYDPTIEFMGSSEGAFIRYTDLNYLGYSYSEWKADNEPSDNASEIHKQSHFISPLELSPAGLNVSLPEGINEATVRWNANGVNITWENPKEEN